MYIDVLHNLVRSQTTHSHSHRCRRQCNQRMISLNIQSLQLLDHRLTVSSVASLKIKSRYVYIFVSIDSEHNPFLKKYIMIMIEICIAGLNIQAGYAAVNGARFNFINRCLFSSSFA